MASESSRPHLIPRVVLAGAFLHWFYAASSPGRVPGGGSACTGCAASKTAWTDEKPRGGVPKAMPSGIHSVAGLECEGPKPSGLVMAASAWLAPKGCLAGLGQAILSIFPGIPAPASRGLGVSCMRQKMPADGFSCSSKTWKLLWVSCRLAGVGRPPSPIPKVVAQAGSMKSRARDFDLVVLVSRMHSRIMVKSSLQTKTILARVFL